MSALPLHEDLGADPAQWLDAHGDYLFSYAMTRVGDSEVAEELVQEALFGALESHAAFENRSSAKTWLVGILKHKIADHFRRQAMRVAGGQASSAQASGEPDEERLAAWADDQFTGRGKWKTKPRSWRRSDVDPSSESERVELGQVLSKCLERLPPQTAEVFLLLERTESSAQRLSKVFGLSTTNIGVILHRARLALRRCLEANWFGRTRDGRK